MLRLSGCNAFIAAGVSLVLSGCEAPLVLEQVNATRAKALQRTHYYQAAASSAEVAVLVGNDGVILRKAYDQEWMRIDTATHTSFIDVDLCPDQRFIALSFDNALWVSDPTATQWTPVEIPTEEQLMTATCAPDASWWVAGSFSSILHSSDEGNSWQTTSLEEDAIITQLAFVSVQQAVATAEYGMIIQSQDGGESWEITGFLPDEFYPHTAYFVSLEEGWVAGLNGFIYHTQDAGETWSRQSTDTSLPLYQLVASEHGLFALGDNSTVLKRTGDQWQTIQPPSTPVYLRAGVYLDGQLVAAGGRGSLFSIDTYPVPAQLISQEASDD